jgi:hypothetical protein
MSVLNSSDTMMSMANTEAQIAGLVLQPAIMIGFQFKLSTGKAANVDKAGQQWRDAAGQVEQVINDLREAIAGVAAQDWTADDRTAHESKVQETCSQLETVHIFLMAVGVALTVFGYALFAYAIFAVGMGAFLDVLAELAIDALAGIVTAELYAEFEAIAATCLTITSVATAILAGAANIVAAVMQGGAALDAAIETYQGNNKALGDLEQAEEVGSAAALANLAQNGINAGLAYANRTKGVEVPGGFGKKSPITTVDLDADRDKDHTWNVGGGATYAAKNGTEYTGGAHVKYGDRGWQGAEVEGKRKDSSGDFSGGKVGWNEDTHGDDHIYAGTSGGKDPKTGSGYKVETNLDYNLDKHRLDNGSVSAGATNRGGDVVKGGEGFTRDEDGTAQWEEPEVNTPLGDWRNGRYFA